MKSYKDLLVEEITHAPQVTGNGKLLVLIDSRESYAEMLVVRKAIIPTLTHYGLPFAVHDLAKFPLEMAEVLSSRGIVIAHERMVRNFSLKTIKALEDGLREGIGLVNLDGDLYYAPPEMGGILNISLKEAPLATDSLQFCQEQSFITRFKESGEKLSWQSSLTLYWTEEMEDNWQVLAQGIMGKEQLIVARHLIPNLAVVPGAYPAIASRRKGNSRVVQWFISPRILLPDFLGHCQGMDDILANSIIWAAKKPFIYNSFPPFVVLRVDDVSGAKKLKWLQTSVDVGFRCTVPIFIDQIKDHSLRIARKLQEEDKAEFPYHALSYYELMGFKFGYGSYRREEVAARYGSMREFYRRKGLRIPKTLLCHWGEIGMHELREMRKMGMGYILGYFLPNDAKHSRLDWNPKPYGSIDLFYDYSPDDPETVCFDCMMQGPWPDFLEGLTIFAGHSETNEIEAIIKRGTEQIIWGLSNGFFGQLFTHEQKVAVIENQDWRTALTAIKRNIERFNPRFTLMDEIGTYIESKMSSRLKTIDIRESEFSAEFEGRSLSDIYLTRARGEEEIDLESVTVGKFENGTKTQIG